MSDYQGNIIIKNPATPTGPSAYGSAPGMWKLNEVAYWIKQGVWPNPAITPDTYFPYVSLLLSTTSLGNANNNLFVDSSGAFNPVSRFGNTTQGSFSPYATNWSNYFNGSSSYLQTTAVNISSGDFTVEAWVYLNAMPTSDNWPGSYANWMEIVGVGTASLADGWQFRIGQTVLAFGTNGDTTAVSATHSMVVGQWYHLAVTRSGNVYTLYRNGTSIGSATYTANAPGTGAYTWIGTETNQGAYLNGYISNARVVAGSAVYTSNFTPPTSPLTAVSGTVLLTCQSNRFRDASSNAYAITPAGSATVTDFGPFSPAYPGASYNQSDITNWSGYFDGTGDYLTAPDNTAFDFGSGNFTIEMWVYRNNATNPYALFAKRNSSDTETKWVAAYINTNGTIQTQVSVNGSSWAFNTATTSAVGTATWAHVAFVRNGSDYSVYVDGVKNTISSSLSGSIFTDTNPVEIGQLGLSGSFLYSMNGSISNFRIVKGTAVYTSNFTPSTTNLTAISGTSLLTLQNAAFTDNSTNNFVITQNGNPTVTGNSPFNTTGYWSNYFDGSTSYLTVASNAAFAFGTSDFTIECWVYVANTSNQMIFVDLRGASSTTTAPLIYMTSSGVVNYYTNGSVQITGTGISANTWNHLAVARSGTSTKLFVNGTQAGSTYTDSNNYVQSSVYVARASDTAGSYVNGYMSNVRIVKGTAVYTSNFTVPTAPLTAVSGTSLLTCQNGRFIDNSTNAFTITVNGSPQAQSFDPFYTATIASNGGSMYFDGSGDYLSVPNGQLPFSFGTSNFTIEAWVYLTSIPGVYAGITDCRTSGSFQSWGLGMLNSSGTMRVDLIYGPSRLTGSTTSIPANTWTHVAVSRSSGTLRIFVNGVVDSSTASYSSAMDSTTTLPLIGNMVDNYPMIGYMSDFRVTKGTALYTANFTPPTAPVTPTPSTTMLVNGMNAGIYDATTINDMETVGNAQVSTVQSKFGGSSVYFGGLNNWLDFPANPTADFGTGDITIECWLYVTSTATSYQSICQFGNAAVTSGFHILTNNNTICLRTNNSQPLTTSGTITANTWNHIALTRASGTTRIFINGTTSGGTYNWTASLSSGSTRRIGGDIYSNALTGYIDDFRVTRGVARYTSNFTPPTQAFPTY